MRHIEFSKINEASVFLRGEYVGDLEKKSEDHFVFSYSEAWIKGKAIDIATSLPVSGEGYVSTKLHPFFDNLIVEGWLLGYAEKVFHIDKKNRFAMLLATGETTIGAVSVRPIIDGSVVSLHEFYKEELEDGGLKSYDVSSNRPEVCPYCLNTLEEKDKKNFHLKCSRNMWGTTRDIKLFLEGKKPLNSFQKTVYGGSVSGAQRKGLFRLNGNKLTPNSYGAQYILKPHGDYDELPENEHATMIIANEAGFKVPPVVILNVENVGKIYAVKRFDIVDGVSLKKEDMAQVLKVFSEDKYESSCEKVARAIMAHSSAPRLDLVDFWRRLLFCYLTANADMHLKNWSLLENKKLNNHWELAPCYDLLNTRIPIPRESLDIGLTIKGKKRNLQKSYFVKFAQQYDIPAKIVDKGFEDIEKWLEIIKKVIPKSFLSEEAKEEYINIAQKRYNILNG
ncbi:MAG: type II toxin-antitoxin system HipA family toxin [Bacteriovoracaceae bacterium]|jgi:serine/threonine-protein kinase HipA|nr:type II toxin-antitoxin system HipA family toxin [Bacteriovoracaceae bacterium]